MNKHVKGHGLGLGWVWIESGSGSGSGAELSNEAVKGSWNSWNGTGPGACTEAWTEVWIL